jgi:transcriptional regulator GlxA family with amidase domain
VFELLTTHLREPWSVARLARALGCSSRSLHRKVRREYGVSPMLLLRQARLVRARAELESASPGTTVTGVALDCGFTHLGRFSCDYASRFGERPSQTLRRARLGHPLHGRNPFLDVEPVSSPRAVPVARGSGAHLSGAGMRAQV